jgi:hypothetical protein
MAADRRGVRRAGLLLSPFTFHLSRLTLTGKQRLAKLRRSANI